MTPRHRRAATVFALPLALWLTACGGTNAPHDRDVPPCAGAVSYHGKLPMHAPLLASDWPVDPVDPAAWVEQAVPPALAQSLEARLRDVLQQTGAPGATVAIGGPGLGLWWQTRGLARTTPSTPTDDQSIFMWDSVGKAYTAALVLDAVRREHLHLGDAIDRWWPSFPEGAYVTIEHLLTHTSGINATEFGSAPSRYESPDELIADAQQSGSLFCPGGYWRYSNTGYVMLGRALEQSEHLTYRQLIEQRVFEPLKLTHSAFIGAGAPPPGLVSSHVGNKPQDDLAQGRPFSAAPVAARADDVLRFWHAWLTGELLPQSTVQASFDRLLPMFDDIQSSYGRGVMLIEWTDEQGRARRWLGHLGGATGSNAVVAYDPLLKVYVAVAINSDVSAVATARRLLDGVEQWRKAAAVPQGS